MNPQVWLENLAAYSLQVAVLIIVGSALVYVFRLKAPGVLLAFWQILLAICLLLPILQPWRPAQSAPPLPMFETSPAPALPVPQPLAPPLRSAPFPKYVTISTVLGAGVAMRFLWLGIGLLRLSRYRNKSRRVTVFPEPIREMQWRVGVTPEILFSREINTPVTFGWRQPAVIFPEFFAEMGESLQRPIACHELLHVRRRDWLFIVAEEILRSLFWFHPAIWWALGRIHLSREQVVDREVLRVTGERGTYLESLLHIASLRGRPVAVPAPLLLREHHLVQRVTLMLKETTMTRKRLIVSLVAIGAFLLWTGTFAAGWFPLTAPPAPAPPAAALAVQAAPQSADRIMIGYENADLAMVIAQIAQILGLTPIDIDPQVHGGATIRGTFTRQRLLETFNALLQNNNAQLIKSGDAYGVISLAHSATAPPPRPATEVPQATHREPLRVGGNVQESKLIYKVDPVYPDLAKQARVAGMVILAVTTDEQGNVADVKVLKGHPLLDQAAVDAVRQWRYSPTYLNGEAVPVVATATVIFGASGSTGKAIIDEQGNVKDQQGIPLPLDRFIASKGTLVVTHGPEVPFPVIERTLKNLQVQGVQIVLQSDSYTFRGGRLFYLAYGSGIRVAGAPRDIQPPELTIDQSALAAIAKASPNPGNPVTLLYYVCVNEAGEIVLVQKASGPDIPEVEAVLSQARVLAPGRRGGEPVPVALMVPIEIR